ncbi:MAG: dihydropteroate synthase [Lysobacterales bacterium]|jgi:dihydropteroate synthase
MKSVRVMGILNVTPDSFSDGGRFLDRKRAVEHALRMAESGADIIDVGGESTRPGSGAVGAAEELDRVIPVIEALSAESPVALSVDTGKPEVMTAAVRAGASLINDVYALRQPGALEAAASLAVPVCLMHMQGSPGDMQQNPRYADVVTEVESFLLDRARRCEQAGIPRHNILIDPGFGFGKTFGHNCQLFHALPRFCSHGYDVLVGVSRKRMLGEITGRPLEERMPASVVAAALAALAGASVVRVHDVAGTVDAVKVARALSQPETIEVPNG